MATTLSSATLGDLPADVPRPSYDREGLVAGIVHLGVGGFHRAHQAMYVDRLLSEGRAREFAICGVGVLPGDLRMAEVLDAQDGLYTLVEKAADGSTTPRVIGSIVDYLHAPSDPEAVLAKLADPTTRIVSLTVTEGGYNIDAVTGEFDVADPEVQHDLSSGEPPRTTFGLVTEGLRRRRAAGIAPFTIMSCDNIEGNGHVAQRVFTTYARLADPELGEWVEDEVHFPNSMVDRITPVTTPDDVAMVRDTLGIDDAWPVVCEPFTQWVLEDSFGPLGRPAFEEVGVQVVDDVRPYELMKLRLLNASHQSLCYFGYLSGYRLVHEVCQDELFERFLLAYMEFEASPTLDPVPGIDLDAYRRELVARFSNANVRDTVARLCAESSDRIPKWLLPVIREQLDKGGPMERAAAVVASWARYDEGTDEQGDPIEIVDRLADTLRERAGRGGLAFVEDRTLFGDLADEPRFVEAYTAALDSLHRDGARATVTALVERGALAPA
ncbi:mannitol dehydrogenase family protein [Jatrophihabitans sp. YIM 134969]